jgi:phenylacetate-CoA ligase
MGGKAETTARRSASRASRAGLALARSLVGGRFTRRMAGLQAAHALSPDELHARQSTALQRIVRRALGTVPYYREFARAEGIAPDDIRSVEDLALLPVVDKSVFRSRPLEDFLAEDLPRWRRLPYTTSGSTGDPFRFVLDRSAMPIVFASHLYYDALHGLDPLDRSVRIMGPPSQDPPPEAPPLGARLRSTATRFTQRSYERLTQVRIPTTEASPERVRAILDSFQPTYLLGYTATLAAIADAFLESGYRPPRPLRAVITIAETLTPERRRALETCFEAPIVNRYGQREFKFWCAQSPPGDPTRFLVNTELVAWETLRNDGSPAPLGEVGRVVLTNLHNEVMPFLRYDTGDLAAIDEPTWPDGPGFPVVTRLDGRTQEVLRTPSGRTIDATTLGHHLVVTRGHVDSIRLYQLIQTALDRVTLRIVPAAPLAAPTLERIRKDLADLLGPGIGIDVETVEDIPLEKSGKRPILKALPRARAAQAASTESP